MATHLADTLAEFTASIQRSKNRLVAIPASTQTELGLTRRRENHLIAYSIRRAGRGRWNHHFAKLTYDNEFAIPSDVSGLRAGDHVEIKIHRIVADVPLATRSVGTPADVLLDLAATAGDDPRRDGSARVDDYLAEDL